MSNEKHNLTEIEKNQLMQLLDILLTLKAKGTAKKNFKLGSVHLFLGVV